MTSSPTPQKNDESTVGNSVPANDTTKKVEENNAAPADAKSDKK